MRESCDSKFDECVTLNPCKIALVSVSLTSLSPFSLVNNQFIQVALDHARALHRHTIANIRAMSPRSLKAHVERAIEQSNNEHIKKIKVVSSNQLKSGDLSIKAVTSAETEALQQLAAALIINQSNQLRPQSWFD